MREGQRASRSPLQSLTNTASKQASKQAGKQEKGKDCRKRLFDNALPTPPPRQQYISRLSRRNSPRHPRSAFNLFSPEAIQVMACIKGASRSAFVDLAPDSPYMAAGTMFGAVDQSFSSSANLEIFKLDFLSDDRDLPVVGECPSSEWFSRLSWGKTGSVTEEFSLGLIAGGLVDGSINLWNPLAIMRRSDDLDGALVGRLQKHSGLVRGLEFNINSPNLLASGAEEGEICIWDLSNPLEPTHYPSLKGAGSGSQSKISFLSWNHKVQHILASTSSNGTTVVWDLKRQKPVISFSDSNRRSCSVLQWNPDLATQLIVASDNDSSPSLKLWDVRNTMSPLKEFVGHTKGVIAMSWCPVDSSFLLTCSKDSRTICWDTVSGEIVCELPPSTNWNFDVHWYPKIPGVISASSFDGKIGIYNIEACSRSASGEGDFAGTLSTTGAAVNLRAPKWLKRPTGLSFGFGGKLVSFHNVASSGNSDVFVHATVTELELVSRSTEFETAIQNGERSSLRALCEKKSQESESEDDRETWGFLKVMFEDDGTARTKLVAHLGFSVPAEMNDNAQGELIQEMNNAAIDERTQNQVGLVDSVETNLDNGEDFFNNLQSPKAELLFTPGDGSKVGGDATPNGEQEAEVEGLAASGDSFDKDDMGIHHALVVGDYKGAVSQCISLNRMADALIIAYTGGAALLESTCNQLLKKNPSSYSKTLSAMVNHDLMNLVTTSPLNSWKETLVFLCTFAQKEEWTSLCDTLASRLMAAGNTLAATLCYICAGNVEKTVEIWSRSLKSEHERRSYVDLLQDLMEKTIILALATGQKRFSASLSRLVENYAELLASQGLLTTAIEFLKLLGPEESSHELAILRERLALSADAEKEVPKKLQFENGPSQTENIYHPGQPTYSAADPSQHYYQESMQQHQHPSVPTGPYDGNYQHPSHAMYGGGYQPLQPSPQTQMFVPTPTPQVPQATFAPSQATSQPATRTFVPSNPPALKNVVPYPQPTLGSQLYPGVGSSVYQPGPPGPGSLGSGPPPVGSIPSSNLPSVMTPTPTPTSFMPVTNPGFVQRPGVGPVQPPSPTMQPTPAQTTVAPPAPPPTVQTVDTSKVPAELKPVITTLTRLYNETSEALGGSRANPAKKREIEDNSRKIGALFARLNNGDISQNAATKLGQLCQALDSGDFAGALHIQVVLTTSDWDECNFWLAALKRMIKTRQSVRL